jgi:hypothetical protein
MSQFTRLKITISTTDGLSGVKNLLREFAERIYAAKTANEFPLGGGGGNEAGQNHAVRVELTCPIKDRIAALRQQADELEKSFTALGL